LLGFNRRLFQTLDRASRSAFLQRAELELQVIDAGLISSGGAWIQVGSAAGSGGWYGSPDRLRFGLSEREKEAVWQHLSTGLVQSAPPTDKPTLTLESVDVVDYGLNRVLRVRFTSEASRGMMHWTVLGFYSASDMVTIAHVGVPENQKEGIAGLEAIAYSFRFA
jgi:hypothetical protein